MIHILLIGKKQVFRHPWNQVKLADMHLIVTAVLVRHSSLRKGGSAKTRSNCSRKLRST